MAGDPVQPPHHDRRFEVLTLDYSMAREDDRTFSTIQVTIAGIAVALLGAAAALVGETCQVNHGVGCKSRPDILLAAAPCVPLAALALLQILGIPAAIRTYYMRALETELRTYAQAPMAELSTVAPIGPASYGGLLAEATSLRRGRGSYRILAIMIMVITLAMFGGLTVYIANGLGGTYRILMYVVYGSAFGILVANVVSVTLGARSTFIRVGRKFAARVGLSPFHDARTRSDGRGLVSYLVIPRPEDWIKWLFIPLTFLLVTWGQGADWHWGRMVVWLLVTEYLVYSARYQWNDIRGLSDDGNHPQSRARMRLPAVSSPGHARFIVAASLVTALVRLLAAFAIGGAIGGEDSVLVPALALLTFAVATLYEVLRSREAAEEAQARNRLRCQQQRGGRTRPQALWLIIGCGYGIRFLVGFHAAGDPPSTVLAVLGTAYAFAFGVMFVLLTWVLEATTFCRGREDEEWQVVDDALYRKGHIMLLLPYLHRPKVHVEPPTGAVRLSELRCDKEPILDGSPDHVVDQAAPWRIAFLASGALAGSTGFALANHRPGLLPCALAALSGLAAAFLTLWMPFRIQVLAVMSGALVLGLCQFTAGSRAPSSLTISITLWLLASVTYVGFCHESYDQLKNFVPQCAEALQRRVRKGLWWIIGPTTWEAIGCRAMESNAPPAPAVPGPPHQQQA